MRRDGQLADEVVRARLISRILLRICFQTRRDHLSGRRIAATFSICFVHMPAAYLRISEPPHLRNLALLRVGFAKPTHHCAAGALLPHHFTLTRD